ncbi:MAG: NAD(P)-binding protein, partial [Geminicoccaceae bacterium]
MPHATGHGWSQPEGSIALRSMKAEGGWGTVAMQMTEIAPDSDMANHPMDRLWDERDLPMHQAQVAAIKKHGALAALELAHGGMRARNYTTGFPVPGPSHLPILRPEVPIQARAMDLNDIRKFREAHKAAALNAIRAGYDILYVYAAHDLSLLSHFLSVRTNQRSDAYGGTLDNRMRLLREVLEDTLEVADGQCAVALRFSVAEPGKAIGLTHDGEGRDVVEALAELPDLWDVNISGWPEDSATSRFAEEGFQLSFTDFVKSITSKPVVGVGRFTSPDLMVALIRKKRLDLIGAARPSIAAPFLPNKIRDGRTDEIRECIGCNICVSMDGYGVPIRCTQNPTIAEEWRRGWHPENVPIVTNPHAFLIVGAGPAGLECAWTLLRAGHRVTIAEARDEPGGRVTLEAKLPGLSAWR